MVNSYLRIIFLLGSFFRVAEALHLSQCGRYLTIEEKLLRARQLEMPIVGKDLEFLKNVHLEVRRNPESPHPKFFLSREELEEYEKTFRILNENEGPFWAVPILAGYYNEHELLSDSEERLLLLTYRQVRDHDIKNGRVMPAKTARKEELSPLQKESLNGLPIEISLSGEQWRLLEKYNVPLVGCQLPLSVQVGKILLHHNILFLIRNFRLSLSEKKPDLIFDLLDEVSREFERLLPFFQVEKKIKLGTFMSRRLRRVIQNVSRASVSASFPSRDWDSYFLWRKALKFTEQRRASINVSFEAVYEDYPKFLIGHLKKYHRFSEVPLSQLVEQRLDREKYYDKEKFLEKQIDLVFRFKQLSHFNRLIIENDQDEMNPIVIEDDEETRNKNEKLKIMFDILNSENFSKNQKIMVELLHGFFSTKEVFDLIKSQFSGNLSKPLYQERWLKLFISEYSFKIAEREKWPLVFSGEQVNAFEEILQTDWPESLQYSEKKLENPFYKIYLLLEQNILPKCRGGIDAQFSNRVIEWSKTAFEPIRIGYLLGMSRENVRQTQERAYKNLREALNLNIESNSH